MRLHYDKEADALEIELVVDAVSARTEQLDAGTLVDLDEQGRLVSIEVIRPAREWPLHEVLERFDIAPDDARVLESLWSKSGVFPVTNRGHAGAVAAGELVRS